MNMFTDYQRYKWFDNEELAPKNTSDSAERMERSLYRKILDFFLED